MSADRVGTGPRSGRKVTATFDGGNITSDAGIVLLRELEEKLGIASKAQIVASHTLRCLMTESL